MRTSTLTAQSGISYLLTTLGSRVLNSTGLANQTTGVTVPNSANTTGDLAPSTQNRTQFSAYTSTNNLLFQGVSTSTAVPTVQKVAANPLIPQNKPNDPVQIVSAAATAASSMTASRPVTAPARPTENGQTSNLPPLSQSNQVSPGISPARETSPSSLRTAGSSSSSLQNALSPGASASYTTAVSKTAASTNTSLTTTSSTTTKKKSLISILWSLIYPALANIKSSYQTQPVAYQNNNQSAITDPTPATNNLSTEAPKQGAENNIEIVHVSYWRIQGGGNLSLPDVGLPEDTKDTNIMESLNVLNNNLN
ncbi:CDKN2A-interacting protein-like [Dendropsophus ebraccatus]|uniref:CDKN2A-interacting protein-like n=1 Tax=Dendropsophus ebraccatus TaxID=150705 RepID=UPI0038314155